VRKLLVLVAVAWVAVSLGAAWLAVDHEVPYDLSFLDARGDSSNVGEDWLYGWGTGLAAPMAGAAAGLILAVTSSMDRAAGRLGAFLLAILGGLSIAYTLANQVTEDRLRNTGTEPVETGLVIATLALAGLLVLVGFTTWLTAPRERYVRTRLPTYGVMSLWWELAVASRIGTRQRRRGCASVWTGPRQTCPARGQV
jgi:hypothetical protein